MAKKIAYFVLLDEKQNSSLEGCAHRRREMRFSGSSL